MPDTTRLLLFGLACLCFTTALTVIFSTQLLHRSAEREVMSRVDSNMKVARRLLQQLGPEIRMANGKLYAGDVLLNGNTAFVDDVQTMVGGVASIFQGDTRVTTNVLLEDGTRGIGTTLASEAVRQALFAQHTPYRGVVDVLGRKYYSRYDPIVDATGRQVGILYVGIAESKILNDISRIRDIIIAISSGSIITVGAFLSWLGSKLAAKIAARQVLLHTAHSHLETALDNMANGIVVWDASHRLVMVNRRLCEVLELPPERIQLGMSYREFMRLRHDVGHLGHGDFATEYNRRIGLLAYRRDNTEVDLSKSGRRTNVHFRPLDDGGWIGSYEDVTERDKAQSQLVFMARHDGLTGLANRTLFQERLNSLVSDQVTFALVCLDLDKFKHVNDELGHPVGDSLLQAVAARLQAAVRESDLVARLGGDEFAIIQPGAAADSVAETLASRVIQLLSEPFQIGDAVITVGVSAGIVTAPAGVSNVELLLKQADVALYCAKSEGRGCYRCFNPSMDAHLRERQQLEADLGQALARDEFQVVYQPLVDVEKGRVSCFEALLRWHHPVRGAVSPAEFIPAAEEAGLIGRIGAWVLRRACLDATCWPTDVKVAVNLSPIQFHDGDLLGIVRHALELTALDPGRLELEITESVLLQDTAAVSRTLHALHDIGVRVAMDDFGTGYSSLSYLRSFPFDKIKIDQSFVREISTHLGSSAIVHAMTTLAGNLGMTTVAEGVETNDQLERVCAEGCGEVQGFLFSKPRPASEVGEMLAAVQHHFVAKADAAANALRQSSRLGRDLVPLP